VHAEVGQVPDNEFTKYVFEFPSETDPGVIWNGSEEGVVGRGDELRVKVEPHGLGD
jgi:hypothetical protein